MTIILGHYENLNKIPSYYPEKLRQSLCFHLGEGIINLSRINSIDNTFIIYKECEICKYTERLKRLDLDGVNGDIGVEFFD